MLEAAQGKFDPAAFEREALALREHAPQYYLTLASRPGSPENKLELVRQAYQRFSSDVGYMARYAEARWMAGRDEEAVAKFDEAMKTEPDHHFVMRFVCGFLDAKRHRRAAHAVAEWLARLHPGASPIEHIRATLSRPRLRDAPESLRHWGAALTRLTGSQAARPGPKLSPPLARIKAPPGAPLARTPASPPTVDSWIRHAAKTGAVPRSPVDFVLLGDSLAELWPTKCWPGRRVLNLGSSGDHTHHLLWRLACFDDGAIEAKAALVIIGANNLKAGEPVEPLIGAVGDVISETRRVAPGAKIVVMSLPPFGPDFQFRDGDRKALNASLVNLPDVVVVGEPAHWAPRGAEAVCYQSDALRFMRAGYERLAAAVTRALPSP